MLASYRGHVGGGKSRLVSMHCLRMREKPHDFMGYRIPSFTNPLIFTVYWRIAPKHVCLELIPRTRQVKARTLIKQALKFALCCIGKGDFTLKAEQLDAIKCIYDGKDVFLWLPTGFGKLRDSAVCFQLQAQ